MRIKTSGIENWIDRISHLKVFLLFGVLSYTFIVFLVGACLVLLYPRQVDEIKYEIVKTVDKARHPFKYLAANLHATPEHILIDIKFKDFQKIAHKREIALSTNYLFSDALDYVPAKVIYGDEKAMKAKLRLKGDLPDHWKTDKWSLRVKLKGENTLFGMKNFSIQHPKTRNFLNEWIVLEALKREGIISVRYKFVDVTINGKYKGIYAMEEHFEKRLIESNKYRDGPIIKFNEDLFWHEWKLLRTFEREYGSFSSSSIDGYSKVKSHNSLFEKAVTLMESFRIGELKTSDVFDIRKMATFVAFMDLFGADEIDWNDLRFYYNPITSKFEPIGFDLSCYFKQILMLFSYAGGVSGNSDKLRVERSPSLVRRLFNDLGFFAMYIKTLERISKPEYLNTLFSGLKDEIEKNCYILRKEYPGIQISRNRVVKNQKFIKESINPKQALYAYHHKTSENLVELELGNIQSFPLVVNCVRYNDSVIFTPKEKIVLLTKVPSKPVNYQNFSFALPEGFVWEENMIKDIKVEYNLLGSSRTKYVTVFPWSHLNKNLVKNDLVRQQSNVNQFSFLKLDEETKIISFAQGNLEIKQNLIIPPGYKVICRPGTQLNLLNSAKILSYSPLFFSGSDENQIIINSSDSTGQGIVVINAGEKSILNYVVFKNLSNPSQAGWELPGAVTFYESPVGIAHSQFLNNMSEDALNIVRSKFSVDTTLFSNTQSDAFDADFCEGSITNSSFIKCGNDGIDVSGSELTLLNILINEAGDKGLSIGENSIVDARHIEIKAAEIGIASKDLSKITIDGLTLARCEIGFTVYQKKSEFGPGSIIAKTVSMAELGHPYLLEEDSTLFVNGKKIKPGQKKVKNVLYGVEYGKSSK